VDVTDRRAGDVNPPIESPETVNEQSGDSRPSLAERDLQSVDASTWPKRDFPEAAGRSNGAVPVVIKQSILNHIHLHGQQDTEVEICGVLVGRGYRDDDGPFVYIEGAIRGDHAESQTAQVTFTSETWNHIYAILDNAFPEQRILGWYHTHPGFGIFLSGMDLFIHDNFFNSPEQFAIVYDPLSGEEGIFLWSGGKATRSTFLIEPDAEEDPPQRPRRKVTAGAADKLVPEDELATQIVRLRKQQTWLLVVVGFLAVVVVLNALVTLLSGWVMLSALGAVVHQLEPQSANQTVPAPRESATISKKQPSTTTKRADDEEELFSAPPTTRVPKPKETDETIQDAEKCD